MNSRPCWRWATRRCKVALVYPEDADGGVEAIGFSGIGTAILGCKGDDAFDWRVRQTISGSGRCFISRKQRAISTCRLARCATAADRA